MGATASASRTRVGKHFRKLNQPGGADNAINSRRMRGTECARRRVQRGEPSRARDGEPGLEGSTASVKEGAPRHPAARGHGGPRRALLGSQPTKASLRLVPHRGQLLMPPGAGVWRCHLDSPRPALPDSPSDRAALTRRPLSQASTIQVPHGADMQPGGQERVLTASATRSWLLFSERSQPCGAGAAWLERSEARAVESLVILVP